MTNMLKECDLSEKILKYCRIIDAPEPGIKHLAYIVEVDPGGMRLEETLDMVVKLCCEFMK